jgi:eukaryotic-like serine/threonine-protein kinase
LAQALECLGEVDLAAGKPAAAVESLRAATTMLGRFAPSGWNRAVAEERLGEALEALGQPGALDELQKALPVLSVELGPEHAETLRAKSALRAHGTATPAP